MKDHFCFPIYHDIIFVTTVSMSEAYVLSNIDDMCDMRVVCACDILLYNLKLQEIVYLRKFILLRTSYLKGSLMSFKIVFWLKWRNGFKMGMVYLCRMGRLAIRLIWARTFFHRKSVNALSRPGNSPELNPVETLWTILKMRLRGETITNRNQMIQALTKD